jgi:hypothetical protein
MRIVEILCEENEDEDLEDFDEFKKYNFDDLNSFPNVHIFAQIRLWITRNKKSFCYMGRILEHKDDGEFQVLIKSKKMGRNFLF